MADVFVSYRHSDRDVVAPIAEGLERRQIDVWFDRVDIRSGERWRERIAEGIKDAQSVLVAVGPEGIAGVQAFEVDLALDRAVLEVDLPIIPLLLPGAKQEGRLWSYLATRSYVEMEGATDDDIVDRIADAVRGTSSTGLAAAVDTGREPYLGLRAYSADDADLFFGREADIDALVELCRAPGLVAVVGPSGSGKSSLVKAGLVPRLQVTSISHLRHWRPVVVEPGADPSRGFLAALLAADDAPLLLPAETVDQCRTDPGVFTTAAMAVVQRLDEHSGLVIVVDQLEQLFTSVVDEGSRRGFGENLAALAAHCPDRVRVLVTLRSDYLDALTQLPALARAVGARHHLLTPMDRDGLRDVIQRPAWECGSSLEPRLVDEIALDVEDQPNALPLLSLALQEMWRRRQGERLTLKAYAEGGRVTGVLDGLAETAIQPLVPPHDALVRATLLRLVHFAPGAPATRRRRPLEELVVFGSDGPIVRTLVGALANARLLVVGDEGVEFAHDAVISSWTRLRDWVSAGSRRRRGAPARRERGGGVDRQRAVAGPPGHGWHGVGGRAPRVRGPPAPHRGRAGLRAGQRAQAAPCSAAPLAGRRHGHRRRVRGRARRCALAADERSGRPEAGGGGGALGRAVAADGHRPPGPRAAPGGHRVRARLECQQSARRSPPR